MFGSIILASKVAELSNIEKTSEFDEYYHMAMQNAKFVHDFLKVLAGCKIVDRSDLCF